MKKFQQKYFFVLAILINIFSCSNLCEGSIPFEISASVLYLKPSIDDSHYVLSSFDNTFKGSVYPDGKRHQVSNPFTPGLTVEGFFEICPKTSSLDLQFTYLHSRAKDSASGDFLYDTNGFPGFGSQDSPLYSGKACSKNTYNFYAGDITYHRTILSSFDNLMFIIGLHWAYIKFQEHTISSGTFRNHDVLQPLLDDLHRNSRFCGVGPQIGLDYQFHLSELGCVPGTLSLNVLASGAILCGNTKSDLRYVTLRTGPGGVGVRNGDLWRVIPSAKSDLGIIYSRDCQCFNITLALGYEFLWYSDCVNKITGLDVAFAADTIDVFNSFSLQGPYLRIGCAF